MGETCRSIDVDHASGTVPIEVLHSWAEPFSVVKLEKSARPGSGMGGVDGRLYLCHLCSLGGMDFSLYGISTESVLLMKERLVSNLSGNFIVPADGWKSVSNVTKTFAVSTLFDALFSANIGHVFLEMCNMKMATTDFSQGNGILDALESGASHTGYVRLG